MLDMTSVTYLRPKVAADTLAARLILMRHEMGWSQRKAAALTGVPFGVWQGMESGRETRGLDRHVVAIAAVSGYDRDWLMWGGTLWAPKSPHPDQPDGGSDEVVRREGIEPPTRWFSGGWAPREICHELAEAA